MARALITGISGQDGYYLAQRLAAGGTEVVGLIREGERLELADGVRAELVVGDLLDEGSLRRAVDEVRPDELYHLAAPTFVPDSWERPGQYLTAIAGGSGALLAACSELVPGCRVVMVSSAEVFGDAGESPMRESTPMRPVTPYGVAKLAVHHLVGAYRRRGLHASSAITFNHESPRRPERFLPRKVTRGAAAMKLGLADELELGSLDAVRDWSDARDVVRGFELLARADEGGDVVLASGIGRTVGDLVRIACEQAGVEPRVRVNEAFVRPPERWTPVGDPTLARERLGWVPEIPFERTLGDMLAADLVELSG